MDLFACAAVFLYLLPLLSLVMCVVLLDLLYVGHHMIVELIHKKCNVI